MHDVTTNSDAKLTDLTDDDGKFLGFMFSSIAKKFFWENVPQRDHPFKTSACLSGEEGVSPCADGQKVTVHKDRAGSKIPFISILLECRW